MVVSDVLNAKKFICLAITEAFAGSDVAGLQTIATKEGNEWVINGTKKYVLYPPCGSNTLIMYLGGSQMVSLLIILPSVAEQM